MVMKKTNFKIDKKRKITRKKPGTKSNQYFSNDTEIAINNYKLSKHIPEKQKIYVDAIMPAFDSLVENLINVYNFKVMYETKKDLKMECTEFLFTTVEKFDGSKGSKAFSYFNVVAKNWLTIKSKKNAKKLKTYVSSDDKDNMTENDCEQMESFNIIPSLEEMMTNVENSKRLGKVMNLLSQRVKSENEIACVKAIQEIINNLDNLEILNKKALLCYLKEISHLNAKQLSSAISNLRKYYKEIRKELNNE